MNLFIKVEDGRPVNHPATEENLRMLYEDFDPENPPEPFEKFARRQPAAITKWQKVERLPYEKIDGVWTDVFNVIDFTEAEIEIWKYERRKQFIFSDTWEWNDEKGEWEPPVPYPADGKPYLWDNEQKNWVLTKSAD